MIHLTRALVRRWLDTLLHIDDSPERTAAAFALGVFFGFSPFLGFHTLLGIVFAFLLNLNRVAVLVGVYSNLPWFLAPYYAAATLVGKEITGHVAPLESIESRLRAVFELSLLHDEFWRQLVVVVKPFLLPFAVGSTLAALLLSAAAYHVALAFIASRRRIRDMIHHHPHQH
jgi:uncharacterized protein (DUF2062 family)